MNPLGDLALGCLVKAAAFKIQPNLGGGKGIVEMARQAILRGGAQAERAGAAGNQLLGRAGGFKNGILDPNEGNWFTRMPAKLGGRIAGPRGYAAGNAAGKAVEGAYLGGVSPVDMVLKSRLGAKLPEGVRGAMNTKLVRGITNPAALAVTGTAAGALHAGGQAVDAYENRYEDTATRGADAIARNAGLDPQQTDALKKHLLEALQGGEALDPSSIVGLNGSALTPEQAALTRSMGASLIRDAASHYDDPTAKGRFDPLSAVYKATRYVSPGAWLVAQGQKAAMRVGAHAIAKPYTGEAAEADINGYLSATRGDNAQSESKLGQSVAKGIGGLFGENVSETSQQYLGKQRREAFGIPLSGNLERDTGALLASDPRAVAKAVFSSGGLPITQSIRAGRRVVDADKANQAAARRALAESAYDKARGDHAPAVSDPGTSLSDAIDGAQAGIKARMDPRIAGIPRELNRAADTLGSLPDVVNAPRLVQNARDEEAPEWLGDSLRERYQR